MTTICAAKPWADPESELAEEIKETEVVEIRKLAEGTYIVVANNTVVAGPYEWLDQAMTAYPNCTQGSGVSNQEWQLARRLGCR